MRLLLAQVPRGRGQELLEKAQKHEGANLSLVEGHGPDGPTDLVVMHLPNRQVEALMEDLQGVPELRITLVPRGVITLTPPEGEAPEQVSNVQLLSPIEIFLGGLQSVGSWRGFLSYAAIAGVVVWIGLFTNTIYLLTGAMLIAPFGGPAMNVAIATARGDPWLLGRGVARYFSALLTTIAVSGAFSFLMRQEVATTLMVETSTISGAAVLLPLVAGAAGALNLMQSERSSLVSGAAAGMIVSASLAPPAGLIGMGAAIGEWDLVKSGVFLLLLQLAGINLSGALLFRLIGLTAKGPRYERGRPWMFPAATAVTVLALGALLTWQFWEQPDLQRSSQARRVEAEIQQLVNESGLARLVEANARFTRADIPGQETLLGVVYVQRRDGVALSDEAIDSQLTRAIQQRLLEQFQVTPVVQVNVLEAPARGASSP